MFMNINGRVCLRNMVAFGVLGCLTLYLLNPFFIKYIDMIPEVVMHWVSGVLVTILVADVAISFTIISHIKTLAKDELDNTDEIKNKLTSTVKDNASKTISKVKDNTEKTISKVKDNAGKTITKVKTDTNERITKVKADANERITKVKAGASNKITSVKTGAGNAISKAKDNADKINKSIKDKLSQSSFLVRRVIKAFPDLRFINRDNKIKNDSSTENVENNKEEKIERKNNKSKHRK